MNRPDEGKGVQFYDWGVIVATTLIISHYPVYVNTFYDRIRGNEGQHLKFAYQEIVVKGGLESVMAEFIISVFCKGFDGAVQPPCL